MNQILLAVLVGIDILLVGLVLLSFRARRTHPISMDILKEIDHEHRLIKELRATVSEDLERRYQDMKNLYDKVSTLATEADVELKSSGNFMSREVAQAMEEARAQMEEPLQLMTKQRTRLSALIQKSQKEREFLQKAIQRAEKLAKFFNQNIPYEELLEEITDKKYSDARFLLAKGLSAQQVAKELGLPESEVQLISAMT